MRRNGSYASVPTDGSGEIELVSDTDLRPEPDPWRDESGIPRRNRTRSTSRSCGLAAILLGITAAVAIYFFGPSSSENDGSTNSDSEDYLPPKKQVHDDNHHNNQMMDENDVPPAKPHLYPGKALPDLLDECPDIDYYQELHEKAANEEMNYCDDTSYTERVCGCDNPTLEAPRLKYPEEWPETARRNMDLVQADQDRHLDVILWGDSITEHWQATDLARPWKQYDEAHAVYQDLFRGNDSSTVSGLALGISGDRIPQLMYRMNHGELTRPETGDEKDENLVLWMLIGTNDLGGDKCNIDTVVAGNIALAEALLGDEEHNHNNMVVVINSLLPRGNLTTDRYWAEIQRVNQHLACYIAQRAHARLQFFNATEFFVAKNNSQNAYERNTSRFYDSVHPNAEGYRVWGQAIVERVKEIRAVPSDPP